MSEFKDQTETYPDVYGYTIKRERKERVVIQGVHMEIKKYTTTQGTKGIRISLLENTGEFFIKFNEYLSSIENHRPEEERALNMWSFTTFCSADPGLQVMDETGFYVYQNHIVFNEEKNAASPQERLIRFVEYYKKRFGLKTRLKEDEFEDLEMLEVGHLEGVDHTKE